MRLYSKYVLPHVIDLAMRNPEATNLRALWIPKAYGKVLEVGIGSGMNLPFYSTNVDHVYAVEPSAELQRMAYKKASALSVPIEFFAQSAEEYLPLADASVDTVVTTWTLCSISNVERALHQMRRVLTATGRFIFLEHGRSPDSSVAVWQDRLTPVWKPIAGGCHLNRKVDDLIRAAGFRIDEIKTGYVPGPRPMTYTYQGIGSPE